VPKEKYQTNYNGADLSLGASQVQPIITEPVAVTQPVTNINNSEAVKTEAAMPQPENKTVYHSDDWYMEYIFQHESSGNPYARNSIGCLGLGQSCPGSKLTSVCPNLGDVACQVTFFTTYAHDRYGSWKDAYLFWIRTDCRPYCGHWW
jgi:hypothetical protein